MFRRSRPEMAFPCLTEDMIHCIRSYGTEVEYEYGTPISTAGQRQADMFVVLTGSINVYIIDDRSQLKLIIEKWFDQGPNGSRSGQNRSSLIRRE
jgi:hypothetical protein